MLRLAGFTPEEAAQHIRRALDTLTKSLEATKVQYFANQGEVTDERVDADTPNRIKAATVLLDYAKSIHRLDKGNTSDETGEDKGTINLVLNLGDGANATLNILGATGQVSTDVKNPLPE